MNLKKLFDYKDSKGNVMDLWATQMPMQKKDRGRLDLKIALLERTEDNLLPKLLHRIPRFRHIMHLVVNGQVALRPMLCHGPSDPQKEFTFLFGATERDRKLVPRNAPEKAEENRNDLILHPEKRCEHERFNKGT